MLDILAEVYHGFPQSLQDSASIRLQPLPNAFQFISHLSSYHLTLSSPSTESIIKEYMKKVYNEMGGKKDVSLDP
jgi:hypothetical protein